jgi:hypothetical protein
MHLIVAMKHINKIRVLNNPNLDFWSVIAFTLGMTITFIAIIIVVLFEAPVK